MHGTAEASQNNLAYRDPLTMAALKRFWQGYFARSHATLVDFGEPTLLAPPN